jgi:hypothetical protein
MQSKEENPSIIKINIHITDLAEIVRNHFKKIIKLGKITQNQSAMK